MSCIPTDNSLANPSIYTTVLHTLTCILVPVNLFGAYCILFKTPKKMEAVKWLMLNLHLLSLILDLSVSFLSVPHVLLPVIGGYLFGVLNYPILNAYLIISLLGGVGVGISTIFENRYFVLYGKNTWWEKIRIPLLAFNYSLIPTFVLPSYPSTLFPEEAGLQQIQKLLPCSVPSSIDNQKLFILAVDYRIPFICSVGMTLWNSIQIFSFFMILLFKLVLLTPKMSVVSAKTNQMQRKFAFALCIQTLLPFTVLFLPITWICGSLILQYHDQLFNNISFSMFSVHGLLSTVTMISVHQPYRDFVLTPLYRLFDKKGGSSRNSITVSRVSIVVIQ